MPLREKCPYSELFWSTFARIRIEYGEILPISPYSVQMRENADQNNSEYGHFSRSVVFLDLVRESGFLLMDLFKFWHKAFKPWSEAINFYMTEVPII